MRQKLGSSVLGICVQRAFIQVKMPSVKLGIWVWTSAERSEPETLGSHQYTGNKLREWMRLFEKTQRERRRSQRQSFERQ